MINGHLEFGYSCLTLNEGVKVKLKQMRRICSCDLLNVGFQAPKLLSNNHQVIRMFLGLKNTEELF